MGTIVENIREIGIFMIAAQAVMHFAPGRDYEKYIKLIASVMVLLLFVRPFVSGAEAIEREWGDEMEQMMRTLEEQKTEENTEGLYGNTTVRDTAMRQIEEEVRSRLNLALQGQAYQVAEVRIQLEETAEAEKGAAEEDQTVEKIRIVMEKTALGQKDTLEEETGGSTNGSILVEDIVILSGTESSEGENEEEAFYRKIFAETLGVGENSVEVVCRGGW